MKFLKILLTLSVTGLGAQEIRTYEAEDGQILRIDSFFTLVESFGAVESKGTLELPHTESLVRRLLPQRKAETRAFRVRWILCTRLILQYRPNDHASRDGARDFVRRRPTGYLSVHHLGAAGEKSCDRRREPRAEPERSGDGGRSQKSASRTCGGKDAKICGETHRQRPSAVASPAAATERLHL